MRIRKLLLFLILLLIPFIVKAEESKITIESITLVSTTGNIEETSPATAEDQTINLDLKMNVPGDSIEYLLKIKNNTNEDYYFDNTQLVTDKDYITYKFIYKDNSDLIAAGTTKEVTLIISYKERVPEEKLTNGAFENKNSLVLSFTTNKKENPNTGEIFNKYVLGIIVISSFVVSALLILNKRNVIKYITVLTIFALLVPLMTKALNKVTIEIKADIEIDGRNAIFLPGLDFNVKMKQLVGDDTSTQEKPYDFINESIKGFKYSETEPTEANKGEANIFSSEDSPYPIYMWFDGETMWWWSVDKTPSTSEEASGMFYYVKNLADISGVETFDISDSKKLEGLFEYNSITDLEPLRNWNTSNVTHFAGMFMYDEELNDISALENWDLTSAETIQNMFYDCMKLENLHGLEKWDISNVKNISAIFRYNEALTDISAIENWDVSNVEIAYFLFYDCLSLTDLSAIAEWNTANITDLYMAFSFMPITDVDFLANWDTGNVEDFSGLFYADQQLTDVSGVEHWDTSSAKSMIGVFSWASALESVDLTAWDVSNVESLESLFYKAMSLTSFNITGWDTSNVKYMGGMFFGCSNLVNYTGTGLEELNTSKVEDFSSMFSYNEKITSLDLSKWDTSSATSMSSMFNDCYYLTSLNLTGWNTSNVTDMGWMFNSLSRMKVLDLSYFDTRNVTSFKRMFNGSGNLETVYVGELWDTSKNVEEYTGVFSERTKLPNFDPENPEARYLKYAHSNEGGYFTFKSNQRE